MRVVFLDFDGPIIPLMSHEHRRGIMEKAWPPCIAALNRITDATGAKIVISSTWRLGQSPEAARLLREWGATGEIIGVTPDLSCKVGEETNGIWVTTCRGKEISAWLSENLPESFVILDDDDDMDELKPFLIQTPFEIGLTEDDADKAIEMLNSSVTA
jgi:hypothetical protein